MYKQYYFYLFLLLFSASVFCSDYSAELIFFTVDGQQGSTPLYPGFNNASCWCAIGSSSKGNIYIAVSNHKQPSGPQDVHGNVAVYKYNPTDDTITFVNDLKSVSQAVDNWMFKDGEYEESIYKVHSFILENSDDNLYFVSYEHPPTYFLRGTHLYEIDGATDEITDISKTHPYTMKRDFTVIPNTGAPSDTSGIIIQYYGIKDFALNPNVPDLLYARTYPEGYIIKYTFSDGMITKLPGGPYNIEKEICYVMIVDNSGDLFFFYKEANDTCYDLLKYDVQNDSVFTVKNDVEKDRISLIAPTASYDTVYCLTYDKANIYRLICQNDSIEFVAQLDGKFYDNMANMAISPDGGWLYYACIANSDANGRHISRCNLQTGVCEKLLVIDTIVGLRRMSYGGINVWDTYGNFYMPIWEFNVDPPDLAILKVTTPENVGTIPFHGETELTQNSFSIRVYPNPLKAKTVITLHLENRRNITLAIYAINGKLIKTLYNGFKTRGIHSFSWDGTDNKNKRIVPGIYILFCNGRKMHTVSVME